MRHTNGTLRDAIQLTCWGLQKMKADRGSVFNPHPTLGGAILVVFLFGGGQPQGSATQSATPSGAA